MAASTLRFAIIVALVVGGIVVIDQAFPALSSGDGDGGVPIDGGGPGVTTTTPPPTGPTGETGGQQPERSPTVVGVRVSVFNGAGTTGLAAATLDELIQEYGYIAAQDAADAPSIYPVTTIYYRAPKDEVEAEFLANDYFKDLEDVDIQQLEPGVADIDRSAQLAIFLGEDFASQSA